MAIEFENRRTPATGHETWRARIVGGRTWHRFTAARMKDGRVLLIAIGGSLRQFPGVVSAIRYAARGY